MEKLIVNLPKFNQKAFEQGSFIEVTEDGKRINGIVTNVSENRVFYRDANNMPAGVGIAEILDGKVQIKVANSLKQTNEVEEVIASASLGDFCNIKRLYIATNYHNRKIAGVTFDEIAVDGLIYVRQIN